MDALTNYEELLINPLIEINEPLFGKSNIPPLANQLIREDKDKYFALIFYKAYICL